LRRKSNACNNYISVIRLFIRNEDDGTVDAAASQAMLLRTGGATLEEIMAETGSPTPGANATRPGSTKPTYGKDAGKFLGGVRRAEL
jgi:hypothetical protein